MIKFEDEKKEKIITHFAAIKRVKGYTILREPHLSKNPKVLRNALRVT